MRVLVTGHNGYIGSVLTDMLLQSGHQVTGLDTYFFEGCSLGEGTVAIPAIRKDIRDLSVGDLEGFDAIIHLAALSNDPLGNLNADCTFAINHAASVRLAELAKEARVSRYLFASSCSLYGVAGDAVLAEDAPFNPITPYGVSKVRVEEDVSRLADSRFSPTFLRNATAYGVSPQFRADIVVNNLTAAAFTTDRVLILSDGTPWRPLVHVEDIGRAFLAVLQAPRERIHNQAFNVGRNAENYTVRELAELVQELVPGSRVEYAPGGSPDPRSYRVDCSKIRKVLPEFDPQWAVREGIQQLCKAFRDHGLSRSQCEGSAFMRIRRIQQLRENGSLDGSLRWCPSSPQLDAAGAGDLHLNAPGSRGNQEPGTP
jgi:nucleoside-diphosphate-sugar epimerase